MVTLHSRQQGKLPRHIYFLAAALIDQQLQVRSLASSPSGSFDLMGSASNAAVGIGECLGTLLRLLPVVVTDYATDEVGGRLPPLCLPCFPATSVKGSSAAIRFAQALSEAWDILLNKDPALLDHLQSFSFRCPRPTLLHACANRCCRRFTRAPHSHAGCTTRPRRRTALPLLRQHLRVHARLGDADGRTQRVPLVS